MWSFLNPALILGVYYVVFKYFLPNHVLYVRDLSVRRAAPLEPVQQLAAQLGRSARRPCRDREEGLVPPRDPRSRSGRHGDLLLLLPVLHHGRLPGRASRWCRSGSTFPSPLLALVCDIVLSAALAVFLSAVNVYLRDVQHLIEVAARGAVLQPADRLPVRDGRTEVVGTTICCGSTSSNPLVVIVLSFQRFIYGNVAPLDNPNPARELRGSVVLHRAGHRAGRLHAALPPCDADLRQGRGQLRRGAMSALQTAIDVQTRLEAVSPLQGEVHLLEGADPARRARALRGLLGAQGRRVRGPDRRDPRDTRAERLGQVDAAQVHRRHPAAHFGPDRRTRVTSPPCSSSAPASSPSCRAGTTSS